MKLKIVHDFKFAHRGCEVVQYTAGTTVEAADPEFIATALAEKWATKTRTRAPGETAGDAVTDGTEAAEADSADGAD